VSISRRSNCAFSVARRPGDGYGEGEGDRAVFGFFCGSSILAPALDDMIETTMITTTQRTTKNTAIAPNCEAFSSAMFRFFFFFSFFALFFFLFYFRVCFVFLGRIFFFVFPLDKKLGKINKRTKKQKKKKKKPKQKNTKRGPNKKRKRKRKRKRKKKEKKKKEKEKEKKKKKCARRRGV
jgi:hypothetical protein